jgi:tetratricopeptide (TPR) repeat protein
VRGWPLLFGLAALGLVAGCQQAPQPLADVPHVSRAAVARGAADQLMERGEYEKAAGKYQEAVGLVPNDMALRFALGTAYSHLGRQAEAAEQFQWAVKRGDPAADYHRGARQWLLRAGLLSDEAAASASPETASDSRSSGKGKVGGPLEWPGVNSRAWLIKVRVTLSGDDQVTRPVNVSRPFRLGERYEFRDLAPGKYRLVAKAMDGAPAVELWNQEVMIEAGKTTLLALSAANSKVSPAQFPGAVPR